MPYRSCKKCSLSKDIQYCPTCGWKEAFNVQLLQIVPTTFLICLWIKNNEFYVLVCVTISVNQNYYVIILWVFKLYGKVECNPYFGKICCPFQYSEGWVNKYALLHFLPSPYKSLLHSFPCPTYSSILKKELADSESLRRFVDFIQNYK